MLTNKQLLILRYKYQFICFAHSSAIKIILAHSNANDPNVGLKETTYSLIDVQVENTTIQSVRAKKSTFINITQMTSA